MTIEVCVKTQEPNARCCACNGLVVKIGIYMKGVNTCIQGLSTRVCGISNHFVENLVAVELLLQQEYPIVSWRGY